METDLFCHWTPQSTVPEMWSWERAGDGMMYWKPVSEGHVRDADQRVLSFAPAGEPSYIRAEWHRRRLREREAAAKAAVKRGKARGESAMRITQYCVVLTTPHFGQRAISIGAGDASAARRCPRAARGSHSRR